MQVLRGTYHAWSGGAWLPELQSYVAQFVHQPFLRPRVGRLQQFFMMFESGLACFMKLLVGLTWFVLVLGTLFFIFNTAGALRPWPASPTGQE